MIRLGKLTDYGLVLMTQIARDLGHTPHTARDLAMESRLPVPTVSKLLKALLRSGLLVSQRGTHGGYTLARDAREISVAEIISALEGEIALTECSTETSGLCALEPSCPIRTNQQIINEVIRGTLEKLMLADLIHPLRLTAIRNARGQLVPSFQPGSGRMQ